MKKSISTPSSITNAAVIAEEKRLKQQRLLSPRLIIIEIKIQPKDAADELTFKNVIAKMYNIEESKSDIDIFTEYAKRFYKELDKEEFETLKSSNKKGISVKTSRALIKHDERISLTEDETKDKLIYHPEKNILEGIIIGGMYGRKRNARQLKHKSKIKDVDRDDVITDDYYSLLYIPMDNDTGYLLLQYYPDITIKKELTEFIRRTLKRKGLPYNIAFSYYYDEEFNKSFENDSVLDHITLSSKFLEGDDVGNNDIEVKSENKGIKLKIEVSTINDPVSTLNISQFMHKIGDFMGYRKAFKDFNYKTATVKNANSQTTFEIDDNLKIKPIIYLFEEISVSEDGIPNFTELKHFCFSKLEDIKKETLQGYGQVTEV